MPGLLRTWLYLGRLSALPNEILLKTRRVLRHIQTLLTLTVTCHSVDAKIMSFVVIIVYVKVLGLTGLDLQLALSKKLVTKYSWNSESTASPDSWLEWFLNTYILGFFQLRLNSKKKSLLVGFSHTSTVSLEPRKELLAEWIINMLAWKLYGLLVRGLRLQAHLSVPVLGFAI